MNQTNFSRGKIYKNITMATPKIQTAFGSINRNMISPVIKKIESQDLCEVSIDMPVHASNPNLTWLKSPRVIKMTQFERDEVLRMRNKQRYLSQSVEYIRNNDSQQSNYNGFDINTNAIKREIMNMT